MTNGDDGATCQSDSDPATRASINEPPPAQAGGAASRRRPAEVRRLLLEAAEQVVIRKGMSANAQEIAREAGVHRSVLYRHFASVEEIVQVATLRPFSEFLSMFQSIADSSGPDNPIPLRDFLYGFLDNLLNDLTAHRDFLTMVLSGLSPVDNSELWCKLDEVLDEITVIAGREGQIRGVDVSSIGVNTRLVVAMTAGLVAFGDWLLPHGDRALDRHTLIEHMSNLILYGVQKVADEQRPADRT
ncbi:TetR/AcrR family transcriptional regulator [Nocardia terrae]|uniref:TetR/AcrR family transcriptional regulator n=1 Tax=Nocardia terrae TaxID=2675851 RepID=UPI0012FB0134|nr:TetR/AcrR family transcriptional regulator [Nocardia terrae]